MNKIIIYIMIVVSASCRQIAIKENAIDSTLIKAETTTNIPEKLNTLSGDLNRYVILKTQDTLFVPEEGKILDIKLSEKSGYYYLLFKSFKVETDFGKKTLVVRGLKNELLWKLVLEDYTQVLADEDIILIVFFERDLLEYYDFISGVLKKSVNVNDEVSDVNDILLSDNNTFIKLINDEDGTIKDVMVINNSTFQKKMYNLNLQGYYFLRKDNNKVYVEGQSGRKYLDQLN